MERDFNIIKKMVKSWQVWSDWKALQLSVELGGVSIQVIHTAYLLTHN